MPVHDRQTRFTRTQVLAILGIVAVVAVPTTVSSLLPTAQDRATEVCQDLVKSKLKTPGSAQFPVEEMTIRGSDPWTIEGSVDSQNTFGALLRSTFECTVRTREGDFGGVATLVGEGGVVVAMTPGWSPRSRNEPGPAEVNDPGPAHYRDDGIENGGGDRIGHEDMKRVLARDWPGYSPRERDEVCTTFAQDPDAILTQIEEGYSASHGVPVERSGIQEFLSETCP